MKVYTKTGDSGTTSLVGGTRVSKADLRLETYGTADELNSFVGLLRAKHLPEAYDKFLNTVQNRLFNLGACLATETDKDCYVEGLLLTDADVTAVEEEIDALSADLPVTHSFVLPAGNERIATAHVCRTVARRLERRMVALAADRSEEQKNEPFPGAEKALQYVNRLSDYFFILSKKLAQIDECALFLWEK